MFTARVSETALTVGGSGEIFKNITVSNAPDASLLSTLRAVISPRIPEGQTLSVYVSRENPFRAEGNTPSSDTLYIIECRDLDDDVAAFKSYYPAFTEQKRVSEYFSREFRVYCFVNEERRTSIVLTEAQDLSRFHFLQFPLPLYLPWYAPKSKEEMLPEEKAALESLAYKNVDKYLNALAEIAKRYDFRTAQIKEKLGGFMSNRKEHALRSLENQISTYAREIESLYERIRGHMRSRQDLLVRIAGVKASNADSDELSRYFLADKNLTLKEASGGILQFYVRGQLSNYDEEDIKRIIKNRGADMYDYCGYSDAVISRDELEILAKAIFVDGSVKVNLCGLFTLDLDNINVDAESGSRYPAEFNDCMPNPHFDEYSCLGSYRQHIMEFISNQDVVGAIVQCEASVRSINVNDPSFGHFIKTLVVPDETHRNDVCIELPTGEVVGARAAVDYLKKEG